MTTTDDLLRQRNADFARTDAKDRVPQIPFIPNRQLYVITCVDPRVDPLALFELQLGDAIVARTIGGRVTDDVLDDLAWISYLHETKTPGADWFQVVVMHHNDCGSALMADDELRAGFVERGFDDRVLRDTAVTDPARTVALDVGRLVSTTAINEAIEVSGYRYDVHTGVVTPVVDATPRIRQGAPGSVRTSGAAR